MMKENLVYIFDIDGTLTSERYENDQVLGLSPNHPILGLALAVSRSNLGRVAVVTARPSSLRGDTERWIHNQGLNPEILLMRSKGDNRPDYEVRVDQVREVMNLFGENATLLDDKLSNCLQVNSQLGIPCIHVKRYDKDYHFTP